MQFSLLGIPIFVQVNFWITAVMLGFGYLSNPMMLAGWVAAVFVSVIVHELGHGTVMMRYGLRPEIALHGMGGHAAAHGLNRLSRGRRIFVSFAGPMAGFVFGFLWIALALVVDPSAIWNGLGSQWVADVVVGALGPDAINRHTAPFFRFFLISLIQVNIFWGFLNLSPVLPLDGGHILEDALGPRRYRTTCYISLTFCALVILYQVTDAMQEGDVGLGHIWISMIFGLCGYRTYMRLKDYDAATGHGRRKVAPAEPPMPQEMAVKLKQAKAALADQRYEMAATQAELVLGEDPPKAARVQAMHILGWTQYLRDDLEAAKRTVAALRKLGDVDPGLEGSLLLTEGSASKARELFEKARADGDDRKEVVGPLIQILIASGEVPRASAIALDIVETLSDDDVQQMAQIAAEHRAHRWAARLHEALFERSGDAEHAYEAARQRSLDGDLTGALILLERAIHAGFTDASRARGDDAFAAIRNGEEADAFEALLGASS